MFGKYRVLFKSMRLIAVLLPGYLLTSCLYNAPHEQENEILWDKFGVPHIYGSSISEMYFGFGWAQMESHADLMLHLYGEARGRASEYWGEDYLEADKRIWLLNIPEQARINLSRMNPEFRTYLEAFVKGVNRYAVENPEKIGQEVKAVLPVTSGDVMAHVLRVICLEFIAAEDLYRIGRMVSAGSNAIAIGPSRSSSGNAMLITNPHLPWSNFFLWFEAHLVAEDFNAYGVSLVGMPTLSMAFNKHLGWALTVNTMDGADRYQLTLQEGGYLFDDKILNFDTMLHEFRVLQPNREYRVLPVTYHQSVHGPVIMLNEKTAVALRIVGMENARILEQFHRMAASSGLEKFEEALKMLQNPMFNIVYADQEGNILYLFNGNVPVRPGNDFAYWKGTIDGTKSSLIWDNIHEYDDLPRVLNPPGGFIQNCNDPPWTCTFPAVLDPDNFPRYMAPEFMHFRAQRATSMIIDNFSISFDDLTGIKLNTGVETAYRFLDDLLDLATQSTDSLTQQAVKVLQSWDKKTDAESRGAVLFTNWFDRLKPGSFSINWDRENPYSTPDGLKDGETAIQLLNEAALEVIDQYGSLDISWGDVHRFRMNGKDLPANGGPERYGIFRTIDYRKDKDDKNFAVSGDTYVAVIEFGEEVKAEILLSYGNASQPGNPHRGDQVDLLSSGKLRPALLNRNVIMSNLGKLDRLEIR